MATQTAPDILLIADDSVIAIYLLNLLLF